MRVKCILTNTIFYLYTFNNILEDINSYKHKCFLKHQTILQIFKNTVSRGKNSPWISSFRSLPSLSRLMATEVHELCSFRSDWCSSHNAPSAGSSQGYSSMHPGLLHHLHGSNSYSCLGRRWACTLYLFPWSKNNVSEVGWR